MGKWLLVGLVVLSGACSPTIPSASVSPTGGSSPSGESTASPAPPAQSARAVTTGPLAAVTDRSTSVELIAPDGSVVARTATGQLGFWYGTIPEFSLSLDRLYYLTADLEIHYLQRDGATGTATKFTLSADQVALFSVSPDDSRIAVSVLSYGPRRTGYPAMRLYVEDLNGAGNHVELFASTTVVEYPIGWVDGRIIVAVSNPVGPYGGNFLNPYGATAYHVADATNGDRKASLCEHSVGPVGWIQPIGTICQQQNGGPSFVRWDGTPFPAPAATPTSYQEWQVALSADGSHVAVAGDPVRIMGGPDDVLPIDAWNVFGWIDSSHIVYQAPGAHDISIFDLQGRTTVDVAGGDTYMGALPAAGS